MIEIRVRDWRQSRAWYSLFLGCEPSILDQLHEFALFETTTLRLSIKSGDCIPGSTAVVFEVDSLDHERERLSALGIFPTHPEKMSPEGYRRLKYADPDGQALILFQWTSKG